MRFPDTSTLLADGAGFLDAECVSSLAALGRRLKNDLPNLDRQFQNRLTRGRSYDSKQIKALSAITLGAAARMFQRRRSSDDFLEQVSYSGRRLAKLNLSPRQALQALKVYDALTDALLRDAPRPDPRLPVARERLLFCTALGLNNAFHQIQRAEAEAFHNLFQAELEAKNLDELLRQFLENLTSTCQAQVGRLLLFAPGTGDSAAKAAIGDIGQWNPTLIRSAQLRQLSRTRYIVCGDRSESLLLDAGLTGHYRSYWSVPLVAHGGLAGVIQLGFSTPRSWLPRELQLLNAAVEQCLMAAEKARLIQDLAAREEQVRQLGEHMWQVEEEERRRISRELHDEAGQSMLFIRLQLEMLEKVLPHEVRTKLAEIRDVTERTIIEIRRIIAALSPAVLEQLGLVPALRQLTSRFRRLYPIRVRLHLPAKPARLPREAEIITYRLVQECYNNIAKHSSASTVNIYLSSSDTYLELRVEDNGVGFEVDTALRKHNSFGLSGMRERVTLLGGKLTIHSVASKGTTIAATLPLRAGKDRGARRSQG
ncbi:MAG: GAF domain-containing sensor histidine kinase [Bryobacteraceae bacterium]